MPKTIEFMDDEVLEKLVKMNLIRPGRLQAYKIYKAFWGGLKENLGSYRAIDHLAKEYCLSEVSVRNIVYSKELRETFEIRRTS